MKMMKRMKSWIVGVMVVVVVALPIILWVAAIYAVIHFVVKYW